VLLGVGLLLLLTNLGNIYLWQDEAETALLSQRLRQYGLPLAFDGRNLIRQAPMDVQYTEDWVWIYHPWLPFYFTAVSFAFLGQTTFAARLPFALAGLATVLLLYYSVRRHFRNQALAMLGSSLLLFCIPFLLHARQCKYFPFAALFTVAVLDAYLLLIHSDSRLARPYLIVAGFCLFQSNFGAFLPTFAGLGLHFLLQRPTGRQFRRVLAPLVLLVVLAVPWAIYLQTWARGRFVFDIYRFVGHLVHYAVYVTGWVFPWPLILAFGFCAVSQRMWVGRQRQILGLYVAVIGITIPFLSATFIWMYFSYIVQLVPLLMVILAATILQLARRSRVLAWALTVLVVATNLLHLFPYVLPASRSFKWASLAPRAYLAETDALIASAGNPRSDLAGYLYELTHDYDGPDEGVALFLREQAKPEDVVVANYGELPILFYTDLDIAGGLAAYRIGEVSNPEWIVDRIAGPYREEMAKLLASGDYEPITIPYADILWGNRPVPEYHKFATVSGPPYVIVHRRLN
jgi:4-amino-4-deoxy-L-arabinose transferase-like glycosyltransferase